MVISQKLNFSLERKVTYHRQTFPLVLPDCRRECEPPSARGYSRTALGYDPCQHINVQNLEFIT